MHDLSTTSAGFEGSANAPTWSAGRELKPHGADPFVQPTLLIAGAAIGAVPYFAETISCGAIVPYAGMVAIPISDPTITGSRPDLRPLLGTVARLVTLPENWDSYGAMAVKPLLVQYGLSLLNGLMRSRTPLPAMVPTSRGGIQLEWHCRGIDLEVTIETLGLIHVSFEDNRTLEEWDGDLAISLEPLDRFVAELSRRS